MSNRRSILCKFHGYLVLIEAVAKKAGDDKPGKCPQCGGTQFTDGHGWDEGWSVCDNDECDFAFLQSHADEIMNAPRVRETTDCRP